MGIIEIDLTGTPTEMEPVKEGVRIFKIDDIEEQPDKDGNTVQVVTLVVEEPGAEDHERKTWERFNFIYKPAQIKFKNMCLAAGLSGKGEGVDTSDLIGCVVKAVVAPRTYKDKDTGETKETTQIKKFLWGEEASA